MKQKQWIAFLIFLAVLIAAAVIVIFKKPGQTLPDTKRQEMRTEEVGTEKKENGQRETDREGMGKEREPESETIMEGTEAEGRVETEVIQSSEKMLLDAGNFPLLGITETVQDTFLVKEMAFRVQVSETVKNYSWPEIKSLTFLETLPAVSGECSFRTSLTFEDGTDQEMEATYREDLGYYLYEKPEEYQKRTESMKKEQEFLQGFDPALSGEGVADQEFLPDQEIFLEEAGKFLYRHFGEVAVKEICLKYRVSEEPGGITYRIDIRDAEGEETLFACTYYPVLAYYSFAVTEGNM